MKIELKDGSVKEYAQSMSVYEIAKDISEGLARVACAGEMNGKIVDLRTMVEEDCQLNIVTANDKAGLQVIRHTASHVLAEAVKRLYPNAKIVGHRDMPNVHKACPCFNAKEEYKNI